MTEIYLKRRGNLYTVRAKGHAVERADVCAAISTLLYTLAGYLANCPEVLLRKQRLLPGDAAVEFGGGKAARMAFDMITVGFLQLEQAAPGALRVTVREG